MKELEELRNAMAWYKEKGIDCFQNEDDLYVNVGYISIQVSPAEIRYRSSLQTLFK